MKKKFINGLLMAALFVGFTSSMVSCKDYDDEKITNLEGELADNVAALKAELAKQKTELETKITAVETLVKNCEATCKAERDKIWAEFGNYYTKTQVDAKDATLLQEIIDRTSKPAVAQTVADLLNEGNTVLITALDSYVANYNKTNGIINEESIRAILKIELDKMQAAINEVDALAKRAQKLAEDDSVRIDGLDALVAGLDKQVTDINTELGTVRETANAAYAYADANKKLIDNLDSELGDLSTKVDNHYKELTALSTTESNHYNELTEAIEKKQQAIDKVSDKVDELWGKAVEIHEKLDEDIKKLDGDIQTLDGKIEGVATDLTTFKGEVAEFETEIKTLYSNILSEVLNLQAYKKSNITSIEINGTYNPMYGELALPFGIRSNMLVVFRGSVDDGLIFFPNRNANYAVGGGDPKQIFTDDDLKMLGASSIDDIDGFFDVQNPQDFVACQQFDANGKAQAPTAGNAGTLYLTVNPTNRDFEGTDFYLINSLNEKVPVELSPLKKSSHKLTFGYTRAGVEETSDNGFYETQVTVDANNAESLGLRFDFESVKDVVTDVMKNDNGISITNIANAVYQNVSDLLDASAVKADWKVGDETYSTVSQYDLGVASVKPLSFNFASDPKFDFSENFPGLGKVEDFIGRLVDKICAGFPDLNPYDMEILDIELVDIDTQTIHGAETAGAEVVATFKIYIPNNKLISVGPRTVQFDMPDWIALDPNGGQHTIHPSNPTVTLEIVQAEPNEQGYDNQWVITLKYDISDEIRHLNDYYTEDWTEGENIVKQIREYVDDVKKFLEKVLNFNQKIEDTLTGSLVNFLESATSKFKRFMTPNKYMQPVLVAKTAKGYTRLSQSQSYPLRVAAGNISLVPTTYNAEALTPAFKKFVAVTNVFKDGKDAQHDKALENVLKAANNKANGLNTVIDGGFSEAYHKKTGISGYTLISNSRGLRLLQHQQIADVRAALKDNRDIESVSEQIELQTYRTTVGDTDEGRQIKEDIEDLLILLHAYRTGELIGN